MNLNNMQLSVWHYIQFALIHGKTSFYNPQTNKLYSVLPCREQYVKFWVIKG